MSKTNWRLAALKWTRWPIDYFTTAILVALILFVGAGNGFGGEPRRIRVLSYNIHHGEGIDAKLDLERIAGVITSVKRVFSQVQ